MEVQGRKRGRAHLLKGKTHLVVAVPFTHGGKGYHIGGTLNMHHVIVSSRLSRFAVNRNFQKCEQNPCDHLDRRSMKAKLEGHADVVDIARFQQYA